MNFTLKHPKARYDMLGYIPAFLSESDSRSAKEQFNDRYRHGGGWSPFEGFEVREDGLKYPGDSLVRLIAEAKLRDEVIRIYENAWVSITQADGTSEVARMD